MKDLNDTTKEALRIKEISETDLIFESANKEISFYLFTDGDIEIDIEYFEINTFILKKEQVDFLISWLSKQTG